MLGALRRLGIGDTQERVYTALLTGADEAGIAGRTGLTEAEVSSALQGLADRGLVGPADARPVPPEVALNTLVLRRLDELREAQLAFAHSARGPGDGGAAGAGYGAGYGYGAGALEVVTGGEAIAERYRLIQRSAREEILTLVSHPVIAVPAGANTGQREAMRAGVRYRVVYDRDVLDLEDAETPPLLEHWASLGEEMRVAFGVPMKLVVADRRAALVVPLDPPTPPVATVLRSSPLIDALAWIFHQVWESALPVPAALASVVDGPLTADDRQLLTLLLNGYTDQAIGSQLGVSMRTVQRRVRRLLALAGARSRLQLGWHAARHGWV
ncbi:LuxR C-terminal-related transcriptional regulator [Streptomyces sp. NPDC048629]|uniref:LuxR C-terminal-related transcriptional regulator n=1 Tax=Streptomyces sp. NPDC048629 TaxID=3154824 RepID=UPI00342B4C6F